MNLIEKFNNNPFVFILIVSSVVSTTSVSITTWFYTKQMENTKSEYNSKVSHLKDSYENLISEKRLEISKYKSNISHLKNSYENLISEKKLEISKNELTKIQEVNASLSVINELKHENKLKGEKIDSLKKTVANLKQSILSVENCLDNQKNTKKKHISNWLGAWKSRYSSGFSHKIVFKIINDELNGTYQFQNKKGEQTSGEIFITSVSNDTIKGVWIQNKNNVITAGKLTFYLKSDNIFEGTYRKNKENYKNMYSWNGYKM